MKKLLPLFILIPFLGLGQVQIGNDINGEGDVHFLGRSIGLSANGSVVAIGIPGSTNNGYDSGTVKIFRNINANWTQIGQDINGDGPNHGFGHRINMSSDGSIIAIKGSVNFGNYIRVFENQNGNWVQIVQEINETSEGDSVGGCKSISSDGSTLVISVFDRIRILKNINNDWVQIGNDIERDLDEDQFGNNAHISNDGNILAISAANTPYNGSMSVGRVKVYQNHNNNWIQLGQNLNGDSEGDVAGSSISLSSDGSFLAIGAPANTNNGSHIGYVKVYNFQNSNWVQIGQKIITNNLSDLFGHHVSISDNGNILAVGAPSDDTNANGSGFVKIYKYQEGSWIQVGNNIYGENSQDSLGGSFEISSDGTKIAIGSPFYDFNGFIASGQVKVYTIASELATLEVVEDIAGNSNGINVTAEQLNSINGVSGAIDGVDYTTALDNGTYVDENNPTTSEIQAIIDQVNATLSIPTINSLEFQLYPNPTKSQFTIQLENTAELENVNIYNNLGQLVLTSEKLIIDTKNLAPGLYLVEIETNKGKSSKKLIIE